MKIDFDKIEKEFSLTNFGQKGWKHNKKMCCPWCGREGKFGFLKVKNSGIVNCFFCEEGKTSLFNYLKQIDRLDLVSSSPEISIESKIVSLKPVEERVEESEIVEVKMPRKTQPLVGDKYLDNRNFLPEHYESFEPSYTEYFLEKKLHNYIIFKIKQEGRLVSWLARSRYDYSWHKENLKKAKLGEESLVLRYRNSDGTEFDKVLGGYDDITSNTTTVILVEGLFDKVGVDSTLQLFDNETVRCCFTFGNKVSENQINLLKKKKGVKSVILLYDYGTIKQSKNYALKLNRHFDTKVAIPDTEDDPGDMTFDQMISVLSNLQTPIEFYANNLNTI